jgi:hypothetical protein
LVALEAPEDDPSEFERRADIGDGADVLTTQVAEEVERARGKVFAAYVRARERARRLSALDDADAL